MTRKLWHIDDLDINGRVGRLGIPCNLCQNAGVMSMVLTIMDRKEPQCPARTGPESRVNVSTACVWLDYSGP